MDHPNLLEAIDFQNKIGSVQGKFLQLDGMKFRNAAQVNLLMQNLRQHGIEHTNFTFYGLPEYHDRFSGRTGDFQYLLQLADAARQAGIHISAGIPLTNENACQVDALLDLLNAHLFPSVSLFVPHEEGRGVYLNPIRLTREEFEKLSPEAKKRFNAKIYKTEGEWVRNQEFTQVQHRSLLISLTDEILNHFENRPFEEIIEYVEALDDSYYAQVPSIETLSQFYGNPNRTQFYRQSDLSAHYQKQYIQENGLKLYNIHDERFCGSRRY